MMLFYLNFKNGTWLKEPADLDIFNLIKNMFGMNWNN